MTAILNFTTDPQYNKDLLINNNWFNDIEDEPIILSMNEEDDEPTPMVFLERVDEFSYTDEDIIINEEVKEELPTPPQSDDEEEEEEQLLLTNYPHNQEEEEDDEEEEYIDPPITELEEENEQDAIDYPNEDDDFTRPNRNTFYRVKKTTEKYVYIIKLTQDTLKSEYNSRMDEVNMFRKKLFYDEEINRFYLFVRTNDKRESNKWYYPPLLKKD